MVKLETIRAVTSSKLDDCKTQENTSLNNSDKKSNNQTNSLVGNDQEQEVEQDEDEQVNIIKLKNEYK